MECTVFAMNAMCSSHHVRLVEIIKFVIGINRKIFIPVNCILVQQKNNNIGGSEV